MGRGKSDQFIQNDRYTSPNRSKQLVFEGGRPWSFTPYNQLWKEVNSSTTVQEALHGARIHSGQVAL
jgi:hypothetical protein